MLNSFLHHITSRPSKRLVMLFVMLCIFIMPHLAHAQTADVSTCYVWNSAQKTFIKNPDAKPELCDGILKEIKIDVPSQAGGDGSIDCAGDRTGISANIMECLDKVMDAAIVQPFFYYIHLMKPITYVVFALAVIFFAIKLLFGQVRGKGEAMLLLLKITAIAFLFNNGGQWMLDWRHVLIDTTRSLSTTLASTITTVSTFTHKVDDFKVVDQKYSADFKENCVDKSPTSQYRIFVIYDCLVMRMMGIDPQNVDTEKFFGYAILLTGTFASGPSGGTIALVGISFVITILIALIQATFLYAVSMVALTMLALFAPIILPLFFFSATKKIVNEWFNYVLVYSLHPVVLTGFLVIALSVINMVGNYYDKIYTEVLNMVRETKMNDHTKWLVGKDLHMLETNPDVIQKEMKNLVEWMKPPAPGAMVTSKFETGRTVFIPGQGEKTADHNGIDFAYGQNDQQLTTFGAPVFAAAAGKVLIAYDNSFDNCAEIYKGDDVKGCQNEGGGFGNHVVIKHVLANGSAPKAEDGTDYPVYYTLYGHLQKDSVKTSARITQGLQSYSGISKDVTSLEWPSFAAYNEMVAKLIAEGKAKSYDDARSLAYWDPQLNGYTQTDSLRNVRMPLMIGRMGNSGLSTASHLHFELRTANAGSPNFSDLGSFIAGTKPINPMKPDFESMLMQIAGTLTDLLLYRSYATEKDAPSLPLSEKQQSNTVVMFLLIIFVHSLMIGFLRMMPSWLDRLVGKGVIISLTPYTNIVPQVAGIAKEMLGNITPNKEFYQNLSKLTDQFKPRK